MLLVSDLAAYLAGAWSFERSFFDCSGAQFATVEGVARFSELSTEESPGAAPRRLAYEEVATLRLAGYKGPSRRSLVLECGGDGSATWWSKGAPLATLDLRDGPGLSEHRCGSDRYRFATLARSGEEFEERWRVRGPAKCYDALTRFRRFVEVPGESSTGSSG